ncbi:MAG: type I methionyl aminopeptidase [Elusimicrobiota bacterium]
MIIIKTAAEIEKMRAAGRITRKVLAKIEKNLAPGVSTKFIDDIAFKEMSSLGVKPAFLGYRGYPASVCISVNNELVHGIPRESRKINDGDIVSIDLGVICDGFYGDMAATYGIGKISKKAKKLIETTKAALKKAIETIKPGRRLGDVSNTVQRFVENKGFSVVREYVGHGIGRSMHEEPAIPNFGEPGTGPRLEAGMVLAIEPMVNEGGWQVKVLEDNWTVVTIDGKLCAHFEHTVAVTDKGCEILTTI